MSTPTTPTLPNGWTFDGTTATDPADGSTVTGDALVTLSGTLDTLAQAQADQASLQSQLDAANASIASLTQQVKDLEAKLNGQPTDDDSADEQAIAALKASIDSIGPVLTDFDTRISKLEATVNALPDIAGTFATIAGEIAALQTATQNAPSAAINQLIAELQAAQQPAPQQ